MGTCNTAGIIGIYSLWKLRSGDWVVRFPRAHGFAPDWSIIKSLFRFGLPTGFQGIAMNIGGVFMLSFIGSLGLTKGAAAQAVFAVGYNELFSLITWTSVGLMGAAAAVAGQNLGAGHPDRSQQAVQIASRYGLSVAAFVGVLFLFLPAQLLAIFGMTEPATVAVGTQLLRVLSVSGLFITTALAYTGGLQGDGRHQEPALHLDHLTDPRAAGDLLRDPANGHAARDRHLARDSRRSRDALRSECDSLQSGQLAEYRGHARRFTRPTH
jgi:Na+-driven multidrug efflux pump